MSTHTPGPWKVGMKPGPIIYGPHGEEIADMQGDLLDPDVKLANLRLILSAPLLLEALRELHAVQNGSPLPSYTKDWNSAMKLTDKAIRLAEGRS